MNKKILACSGILMIAATAAVSVNRSMSVNSQKKGMFDVPLADREALAEESAKPCAGDSTDCTRTACCYIYTGSPESGYCVCHC